MEPGIEKNMRATGDNFLALSINFFLGVPLIGFFCLTKVWAVANERSSFQQRAYTPITEIKFGEECCVYGRQFCTMGENLGDLGELDSLVYGLMVKEKIPNAVLNIGDGLGRLVKNVAYTNCQAFPISIGKRKTTSPQSIFRYADLSQMITGGAVSYLEGRGMMDLSHRVATYLPFPEKTPKNDLTKNNKAKYEEIRLKDLLTHQSGWEIKKNSSPFFAEKKIAKELGVQLPLGFDNIFKYTLNSFPIKNTPGKKFNYNHWDYVLIEKSIEKVINSNFFEFVKSSLFLPLGMNSVLPATNGPENSELTELDYFTILDKNSECRADSFYPPMIISRVHPQDICVPYSYGVYNFNNLLGSLGLKGTAIDMMRFLKQFHSTSQGRSIITPNQWSKLHDLSFVEMPYYYGYGLKRGVFQTHDLSHTGNIPGVSHIIALSMPNKTKPQRGEFMVGFFTNKDYPIKVQNGFVKKLLFEKLPKIKNWGDRDRDLFFHQSGQFISPLMPSNSPKYDGEVKVKYR